LGGFLMVSTWRFWSGKEINLTRSHPFQLLLVIAIVLYVMIRFSNVFFFAGALIYMFSGIWARAAYSWSRRRRRRPGGGPAGASDPGAPEPDPLRPA
jgi:CDP-diacylglycerol--serine O-phosphatidyltransferase